MKECRECRVTKPLSEFNRDARTPDGRQQRCRECFSRYNRERYVARQDETKRAVYKYRRDNPERVMLTRVATCKRDPSHKRAYKAVEAAVACDALIRPARCSRCGNTVDGDRIKRIEAHHIDYAHPLAVLWLCTRCHSAVHKEARP